MAPNVWTDRHATIGYWGEVTSTLDWCEENYTVVLYVAEFWNTVSSVLLILLPLFLVHYSAFPSVVDIVGVSSISVVGVGSVLFHGTLLFEMQLMDELPMLVTATFLVYREATITLSDDSVWRHVIGLVLFVFCVGAIVVYLVMNDPVFHEACYAILMFSSFFISLGTLVKYKLYRCSRCMLFGYLLTLFAFGLWNIDNAFCPSLRSLRDSAGHLGPAFELHAWWHLLCGIGAHAIVLSHSQMLLCYREIPYEVRYFIGLVPYIHLTRKHKDV